MAFSLKENGVKLHIHEEEGDKLVMNGKAKNESKGLLCCVEGIAIILARFGLGKTFSNDNPQLDEDLGENGSNSASNGVQSAIPRAPVVLAGRLTKDPTSPPPNTGQDPQHN